jgi:formylglycine-generating enzyme required for sulfatase activity
VEETERLLVGTADGERQLDFPVALGGEISDAAPAARGAEFAAAVVGLAHGRPFVQRLARGIVTVNGTALEGSHWLQPGDALDIDGRRYVWRAPGAGNWSLTLAGAAAPGDTLPPDPGEITALASAAGTAGAPAGESAPPATAGGPFDAVRAGGTADGGGRASAPAGGGAERIAPVKFERGGVAASRRRGLPPQIPIALVLLLFAAGLWFVFTARSVTLEFAPPGAAVSLGGSPWQVSLGERRLMRPGEYVVRATLEGYHPLEETFTVDGRAAQSYGFELRKLPGRLAIETDPPAGVRLLVDGETAGTTPLAPLSLEPGLHTIAAEAPRYQRAEREVDIEGLGREQSISLSLAPDWAVVRIETTPPGAEIRVDEQALGITPAEVEILSGRRELALKLAGHKRVTRTLDVEAGATQAIGPIPLDPADGLVVLRSDPAGAIVTVDGRYRGQAPVEVQLAPGRSHEVKFTKAGYRPWTRAIDVRSGREQTVTANLDAVTGTVRVNVDPPEAVVYVDGREIGRGPQRVDLPAVEQRIVARLDGYAAGSATVTPQPGFEQEVAIALLTEAEAAYAAIPKRPVVTAGIELVFVDPARLAGAEAGALRFTMGSSRRDPDRLANEVQYDVELRRPFYVSTREITNAQFRRFDAGHRSGALGRYSLEGPDQPVVRVTWQQAAAFCNWLSRQEGLPPAYVESGGELVAADPMTTGYRLPTEAEWAWLARFGGGPERRFPWGERLPPVEGSGNYAGVEARVVVGSTLGSYEDAFVVSAPVASYGADRLGLRDMGGNVAEWVHDLFGINVDPGPLVDPLGPERGGQRVIRGSSFLHGGATELRLTYRDFDDLEREDVGFRVGRYYR